jgi:hypothetical protein
MKELAFLHRETNLSGNLHPWRELFFLSAIFLPISKPSETQGKRLYKVTLDVRGVNTSARESANFRKVPHESRG